MMFSKKSKSFLLFLLTQFFASSCKVDTGVTPLPEKERASLHFLNAYSRAGGAIDLRLISQGTEKPLVDKLDFLGAWPANGYASIFVPVNEDTTGRQTLTLQVLKNTGKTVLVPNENLSLVSGTAASIILIDSFTRPLLVRTIDNFPELKGDSAAVRFMNLNYTIRSVTLETKNKEITIPSKNFLNFSTYRAYKTGTFTFYFKDDLTRKIVDSIPGLKLSPQSLYNFYLTNELGKVKGRVEVLQRP